MEFAYGADRQRVRKTVKDWSSGGNVKYEEDWVSTYYIRDASGNPMAIYERSFAPGASGGSYTATFALEEWPMYGSARLGSATDHDRSYLQGFTASYTNGTTNAAGQVEQVFDQATIAYPISGTATGAAEEPWQHKLGHKRYELNDHLGNVKATISDRRYAEGGGSFDHFAGVVVSSHDYYPYGMPLPARLANMGDHRFAFQGQEMDDELHGSNGTSYAFEYRIHDPRTARFFSVDPLSAKYSWNSPYSFCENRVIDGIDLEDLEFLSYIGMFATGYDNWGKTSPWVRAKFLPEYYQTLKVTNFYELQKQREFESGVLANLGEPVKGLGGSAKSGNKPTDLGDQFIKTWTDKTTNTIQDHILRDMQAARAEVESQAALLDKSHARVTAAIDLGLVPAALLDYKAFLSDLQMFIYDGTLPGGAVPLTAHEMNSNRLVRLLGHDLWSHDGQVFSGNAYRALVDGYLLSPADALDRGDTYLQIRWIPNYDSNDDFARMLDFAVQDYLSTRSDPVANPSSGTFRKGQ